MDTAWDTACVRRKGTHLPVLIAHVTWVPVSIIVNIIALATQNVSMQIWSAWSAW
jgi:hypothetical protein